MSKVIPATSQDVRDYFVKHPKKIPAGAEKSVQKSCKGRIKGNAVDVFNSDKSHGMHYEPGVEPTMPLTYKAKNHRECVVHLPKSRVRELAGKPGSRGRLSQRDLAVAAEMYVATK